MPFSGLVLQNADHQLQMRTVTEEVEGAIVAGRIGASGAGDGDVWLSCGRVLKTRLASMKF